MGIVERLQNVSKVEPLEPLCMEAADEIERLRQLNAELLEALKKYKCDCHPNCWDDCEPCECDCGVNYCGANANRAIAKATGGE